MTTYDHNISKINELAEHARWPCTQLLNECIKLNLPFRITEAFRSQARQNYLYAQGRTRPGPRVTWTLSSTHTKRLAFDVVALFLPDENEVPDIKPTDSQKVKLAKRSRYAYVKIADVARKYDIYRPADTVQAGDYGHFQVDRAHPYQPQLTLEQQMYQAARQIAGLTGNVRERAIERYRKRFGQLPVL